MIFDRLEKQFFELIAAFEAGEITYSEFEYEFTAFGEYSHCSWRRTVHFLGQYTRRLSSAERINIIKEVRK